MEDPFCLPVIQDPWGHFPLFKDQGHTAMDGLHRSVCPGSKDYKMRPVFILPAASGHKQHRGVFPVKRAFFLPAVPLIKPRGGDHNTAMADTVTKKGLFPCCFTSGIKDYLFPLKPGKTPFLPAAMYGPSFPCQDRGMASSTIP